MSRMTSSRSFPARLMIFGAIALGLPAFAAAQRPGGGMARGAAAPAARPAAAMPRGVAAAPRPTGARVQGARTNVIRVTSPRTRGTPVRTTRHFNNFPPGFSEFSFNNVPGLGFDFPHFAAIQGNTNVLNRHRGRFFGGVPFFDGGFLFGSPSIIIEQPAPVEPEVEPEDAIAGGRIDPEALRRSRRSYEADAAPAAPIDPGPQREVEQYVFVRRDGSLVFAVAYTWDDDTLRYVTPEGVRRTIERDALDIGATQKFNEQHGVDFRAPA